MNNIHAHRQFARQRFAASILLSAALLCGGTLGAVEISPVLNAQLLGGQYFFESQESKLSGNASLLAAPAIGLNESWSVIPTLSASWRGTKSVQDLVGGGTLFQQTQDHSFNLKGIYTPNDAWHLKAGGGYRIQLLKETSDEKWGKGLFDFQKPSGNLEMERVFSKEKSLRLGYDFYWVDFRNFSSLESQNRDLGRENASAKTLNTTNHGLYLAGASDFPFFGGQRAKLDLTYYFTFRNFDEQKIVLLSGDLSGTLRKDKNHIVTSNFTLPFFFTEKFKLLAEIRGNFALLDSNQNNYDARKTQFNPNFYAYRDLSGGSNLNFILGEGDKPVVLSSGFTYVRRSYADRPVQDDAGNYGSGAVHTNEYYANFGAAYPITKNFRLQALGSLGWSRSNMKYEKTYRYNYNTATYLMGVTYSY